MTTHRLEFPRQDDALRARLIELGYRVEYIEPVAQPDPSEKEDDRCWQPLRQPA